MTITKNEVTIPKTDKIIIPSWLALLIVGVCIPVITSYSFNKSMLDKQGEQIQYSKESIKSLEETKVDRTEFKIIQDQLKRIEDKLDNKN